MVRQRQLHHLEAVFLRNQVDTLLVGLVGVTTSQTSSNSRMLKHVVGDHQVSQMHRVERPEIQAHTLGLVEASMDQAGSG